MRSNQQMERERQEHDDEVLSDTIWVVVLLIAAFLVAWFWFLPSAYELIQLIKQG